MNCTICGKKMLVFDGRVKYCDECSAADPDGKISVKPCIICGEDVINTGMQRKELHPQCVYDDIYDTIAAGGRITAIQYSRAANYDVSIKEVRQIVREDKEGRLL